MNGLFLHSSNRLEALVQQLAKITAEPLPSPLQPEIILVQSVGMSRWVSLQLASATGICMNCEFPFPRAFINRSLEACDLAVSEAFTPEWMTWMIHSRLPGLLEHPAFAPVARYAHDGTANDPLKLYQLATRLANLFDQYLVYRPEMLLAWERDQGEHTEGDAAWQAILWRHLNPPEDRKRHFAAALKALAEASAEVQPESAAATQRISIFGISSLPPAQMEVFYHLAATRPVHLFLLAPSSEYYKDDMTKKQRAKRNLPDIREDEAGNPLLTSLGRLNAHFTEVILNTDELVGHRTVDQSESYLPPVGESLLMRMQRDILLATPPSRAPYDPADRSIQIHVCHSEMREVEVLYDQLLTMFDADPHLLPREVLVMAPDIEKYAPFIHAVFGNPEIAHLRIPYSVADRHPRSESLCIDTFLRLIELPGTRCTANQIFGLLQSGPFKQKFAFSDDDLEQIRVWIDESGIRWGLDLAHRESFGVAQFPENTWRYGLDRLLLGYAMPGAQRTMFEEILPHDDVEGGSAELLGRFASALDGITQTLADLGQTRTLAEWPPILEQILTRFFDEAEPAAEEGEAMRHLRTAFAHLTTLANETDPTQEVAFEVLREALSGTFGQAEGRGRFLTGGITFCALKPMRSIPAKVIWLLGMDDGAFPRQSHPVQFDLIAKKWKLGDRSTRDDDRYIFLEALISARQGLCISTIGRSIRSNEVIPPSIVVSELLDYLEPMLDGADPRETLVTHHRLHAFSPTYFDPEHPTSYSLANAAAACVASNPALNIEAPFLRAPLGEPEADYRQVTLDQLIDFIANPSAYFLRHRLSLHFRGHDETLSDYEPTSIDHLSGYQIKAELLHAYGRDQTAPEPRTYTARGLLPPGSVGQQLMHDVEEEMTAFHHTVRAMQNDLGPKQAPLSIQLKLGAFHLSGTLNAIYGSTLFLHRHATIKVKDRIRAWVQHLAYSAICPAEAATRVLGTNELLVLTRPETPAAELLERLLAHYWRGLSMPIPLFPQSALAYAAAVADGAEDPIDKAKREWDPPFKVGGYEGEYADPAFDLCFTRGRTESPLDEAFCLLALDIFTPMLQANAPLDSKED